MKQLLVFFVLTSPLSLIVQWLPVTSMAFDWYIPPVAPVTVITNDNVRGVNSLNPTLSGNNISTRGKGRDYLEGGYNNDILFGKQGPNLLISVDGNRQLDGDASDDKPDGTKCDVLETHDQQIAISFVEMVTA
ncbi:MAG: hypothetical protein KJ804_13025 [Proteobacteria bacterium]|nr:hypothetical protein [Pseudomonadota bacterium]